MYPIHLNTSVTPGTDCLDGFKCNEDGLCAKCPPQTTSTPETRTLPKELDDYVEVDGDDYDEDFPTREPILDSGLENFLQFRITILIIKMKILFIIFSLISISIITSSIVTLDEQQSDFIDLINEERRNFAIKYKFGNIHKLYWNETLQDDAYKMRSDDLLRKYYITPVESMDQKGIDDLNRARDKWWKTQNMTNIKVDPLDMSIRHEYIYPWQTTVACIKKVSWTGYDYTCFFGPEKWKIDLNSRPPGTNCQKFFGYNDNGLCAKDRIKSTTNSVNPNNISTASPTSEVSKPQTNQQVNHSTPSNPNPTLPGPKNSENSNTRKMKLSPETQTLPKELEDYVEVDGDDYDENFPTGEPPLDSGFKNFLQFWITVVLVLI
ncbi:hypothetical protein B9Z55_021484 [Caenorhabditis nigoni]|nr:hypothetical protein B9Z55_021484 [Caenorhabditis nigoni]